MKLLALTESGLSITNLLCQRKYHTIQIPNLDNITSTDQLNNHCSDTSERWLGIVKFYVKYLSLNLDF